MAKVPNMSGSAYPATTKQREYAEALARELGVGQQPWHLLAWHSGMSDSMSYRKMNKFNLSKAITAAVQARRQRTQVNGGGDGPDMAGLRSP